ncbi:MAG TPA: nucleoside-diphosphate kinase [Bacteroidales bacterium]|nr:nucleoside-diphosphate kinase [Bacteroidales bacterium]
MAGNITFTMIKPDATARNLSGEILAMITKAGFKVKALKMTRLSKAQAEGFYAVHREKSFFSELVEFITSGPVIAAILEKDNAVEAFRALIGATNPANAAEGSVRKLYGTGVQENAIHGSDCDENAIIETNYFFSQLERF